VDEAVAAYNCAEEKSHKQIVELEALAESRLHALESVLATALRSINGGDQ